MTKGNELRIAMNAAQIVMVMNVAANP